MNTKRTLFGTPEICCTDVTTSFTNNDAIRAYVFINMMLFTKKCFSDILDKCYTARYSTAHVISSWLTPESLRCPVDIRNRQITGSPIALRSLAYRLNILRRRFYRCSVAVKRILFKTYCICLYDAALQSRYNKGSLRKLSIILQQVCKTVFWV